MVLGKISLDKKGTIIDLHENPSSLLVSTSGAITDLKACPHHNYNFQTISMDSAAFERANQALLVDEVRLDGSPLKLHFASFNRNALDTGIIVQVNEYKALNILMVLVFQITIDSNINIIRQFALFYNLATG